MVVHMVFGEDYWTVTSHGSGYGNFCSLSPFVSHLSSYFVTFYTG